MDMDPCMGPYMVARLNMADPQGPSHLHRGSNNFPPNGRKLFAAVKF